jgi:competence protein ComEC
VASVTKTSEMRQFSFPDRVARLGRLLSEVVAAQHGQLVLWVPVAVALGIGLHFALPWHAQRRALLVMLIGLTASLIFLARHRRNARGLVLLAALAALGLAWAGVREQRVAAPRLARDITVTLKAQVVDVTAKHALVMPLATDRDIPALTRVRLTLPKSSTGMEPGVIIRVRGRLMRPQPAVSPEGYDFARMAWFQQIGATGRTLGPVTILQRAAPGTVSGWFDRARERAAQRFQNQIPGEAGKVAAALIVGERNSLSEETTSAMRIAGLAHLLSVSGFHLMMVAGAVFMGTRHVMALSPWIALHWPVKQIAAGVAIIVSIGYTLLTGAAYPSLRAMLAIIIMMVAVMIGRSAISLRLVAVVGLMLLLYRPEALLDVSFQLSFMGVAALVAVFDSRHVRHWLSPDEKGGWIRQAVLSVISTLLATFVAELALAPIAIAHFNQLGLYGLLANVVGVPVTGFILMPLGFLSLVLQPVGLDILINPVFGFVLEKFIAFALWISHLPAAQIRIPEIGGPAFACLMFGQVSLLLLRGKLRWLAGLCVLAGVTLALGQTPPHVRLAPDGRTVAVRSTNGTLTFPDLRGGSFARKSWLEDEAENADAGLGWQNIETAACTQAICTVQIADTRRTLALMSASATPDVCPTADILIDLRKHRWHKNMITTDAKKPAYCTATLYIDKRWLRRTGAAEIRITGDTLQIKTYARKTGDHGWATAAQPVSDSRFP